jgi:hypothetical protein
MNEYNILKKCYQLELTKKNKVYLKKNIADNTYEYNIFDSISFLKNIKNQTKLNHGRVHWFKHFIDKNRSKPVQLHPYLFQLIILILFDWTLSLGFKLETLQLCIFTIILHWCELCFLVIQVDIGVIYIFYP